MFRERRQAGGRGARTAFVLAFVAAGCDGAPMGPLGEGEAVLAPLSQLSFVELDDDPLASHRPDEIDCNSLVGWTIEAGLLEVDTAQCNYLAVSEPAVIAAPAGVWVKTRVTHFDLTAAEPAEAHLAILVRQTLMWETTIAIPSPGEVLELSFELPVDVEVGDPVVIHLHNHGQNSWNFEPLVVTSQP